jgi:hypothetical protein
MRSQMFRTPPTLVGPYGAEVLKDVDGAYPFTLFVENVDVAASLRTRFGSKNANVRFAAVSPGAAGNDINVAVTAGPGQAFAVAVSGGPDVEVSLRCDASGKPDQLAADVVDLLNADAGFAAVLRASLALGSDGGASMEVPDPAGAPTVVVAAADLAGGFDATNLGAVTVEYSPTGAPNFAGPWEEDPYAGVALSDVLAGYTGAYQFPAQARGVRVTMEDGGAPTMVVVSAVRGA